jgi:hypothetical protein
MASLLVLAAECALAQMSAHNRNNRIKVSRRSPGLLVVLAVMVACVLRGSAPGARFALACSGQ